MPCAGAGQGDPFETQLLAELENSSWTTQLCPLPLVVP
jgi:hypothetical protein